MDYETSKRKRDYPGVNLIGWLIFSGNRVSPEDYLLIFGRYLKNPLRNVGMCCVKCQPLNSRQLGSRIIQYKHFRLPVVAFSEFFCCFVFEIGSELNKEIKYRINIAAQHQLIALLIDGKVCSTSIQTTSRNGNSDTIVWKILNSVNRLSVLDQVHEICSHRS